MLFRSSYIDNNLTNYYTKSQTDTNILNTSNNLINFCSYTSNINYNYTYQSSNFLYSQISLLQTNRPKISNFYFNTLSLFNYGGTTYYTYDINLVPYINYLQVSDYVKQSLFSITTRLYTGATSTTIRYESSYRLMLNYRDAYPNQGTNIKVLSGNPTDDFLTIVDNYKLVRNDSPYYLTYLAPTQGTKILCTIINEI